MAAGERAAPGAWDGVGLVMRAGLGVRSARMLRRVGRFAEEYPVVGSAWRSGGLCGEHARPAAGGCC